MGFSRVEYPFSGGSQVFDVNFALGVLDRADVTVHVVGENDGLGNKIFRPFTWITDNQIEVDTPLQAGDVVQIDRTVDKTSLEIDLLSQNDVTRTTLVRAFTQLMMLVHELLDGRVDEFADIVTLQAFVEAANNAVTLAQDAQALAEDALDDANTTQAAVAADAAQVATDLAAALVALADANQASADTLDTETRINTVDAAIALIYTDIQTLATNAATSETNAAASETTASNAAATVLATEANLQTVTDNVTTLIDAANNIGGYVTPIGAIMDFPFATAPIGWRECNGFEVTSEFPELRQALIDDGSRYGTVNGNPRAPDYRGTFRRSWDNGRGLDPGRAFASYHGDKVRSHSHARGTLTTNTTGNHQHSAWTGSAGNHAHQYQRRAPGDVVDGNNVFVQEAGIGLETVWTSTQGNHTHSVGMSSAGNHSHSISGSTAAFGGDETAPRSYAVLTCIKVDNGF